MLKVSKILIDRQENPAALSEPTPYLGWQLESDRQNVHRDRLPDLYQGRPDALLGQRAHHRQ